MRLFALSERALDVAALRASLADPACGGFAAFEGWVCNSHEGRQVLRLEYEAFAQLAQREGERILAEACAKFGVPNVACAHRTGLLELGDVAVWVGATSPHRDEAFRACRYVIDEVKHRLPIWKKEHYVGGDSGWVNCERCALPGGAASGAAGHAGDAGDAGHDHDAGCSHAHGNS